MPHSAFEHLRSHPVPALRLEFQEYRHRATGARHLHLAADDPHNAFMVAFPPCPRIRAAWRTFSNTPPVRQPALPGARPVLHGDDPPVAQHLHECLHQQRLDRLPFASQNKRTPTTCWMST